MLTPQKKLFIAEYPKDLNATQAAIRAGYSEKTAASQGQRLLKDVEVRAAIDVALATRIEKVQVDAVYVLNRLFEMAEADRADLYDDDGALKPIHEWPAVWRKGLVNGIEVEELFEGVGRDRKHIGRIKKIKTDSGLAILNLLGKHVQVNAFAEQVNVKVENLGDRLARAKSRLNGGAKS